MSIARVGRLAWLVAMAVVTLSYWTAAYSQTARTTEVVPVPIIGHPGGIHAAYSASGRTLVTGGGDNTLKVWDAESRRLLRSLECHKGPTENYSGKGALAVVTAVAISQDGRLAVSGGADGAICVWQVETGKLLRSIAAHKHNVASLYITPDARTIISTDIDSDPAVVPGVAKSGGGTPPVQSADRNRMGDGAGVRMWSLESGSRLGGAPGGFASVTPAPDGRSVLVAYHKDAAILYEIPTGRELAKIPEAANAVRASFQKDGVHLVVVQNRVVSVPSLHVIELATGKLKRTVAINQQGTSRDVIALSDDYRAIIRDNTARYNATGAQPEADLEVWRIGADEIAKVPLSEKFDPDSVLFLPHNGSIMTTKGPNVVVWDTESGKPLTSYAGSSSIEYLEWSPDGERILSRSMTDTAEPMLWSKGAGVLERMLSVADHTLTESRFSTTSGDIVAVDGEKRGFVWETARSRWRPTPIPSDERVISDLHADGRMATFNEARRTVTFRDIATGQVSFSATLPGDAGKARSARFSTKGTWALVLTDRETSGDLFIFDLGRKRQLRRIETIKGLRIWSANFSPDEKWIALLNSKRGGSVAEVRDVVSNALVKSLDIKEGASYPEFSPEGKYLSITSGWTARWGENIYRTKDWNQEDFHFHSRWEKQHRQYYDGDRRLLVSTGWASRLHSHRLVAGPDPKLAPIFDIKTTGPAPRAYDPTQKRLAIGDGKAIRFFDINDGRVLFALEGHLANVSALQFSANGRELASGGEDGSIRLWDLEKRKLVSTSIARGDEEWITITPEGFFTGSPRAAELLSVARGLDSWGIDQLWQSLYNPDLVREKLAGDANGEVARAAIVTNLDKVVGSGAPPKLVLSPLGQSVVGNDGQVEVEVNVVDMGGGIGRIEWRVNGVTTGISDAGAASGAEQTRKVRRQLVLDPGRNNIEVVAYNGRNLMASSPVQLEEITWSGRPETGMGRLFVLAIGINGYSDASFRRLNLAVDDARGLAEALKSAGREQYAEVRVVPAYDADATLAGLERLIDGLAGEIQARDTFILFAAAHGTSQNGRFYLIPHGFSSQAPGGLAANAVGQGQIQDWVANRIKARRILILLDTCESGALIGGYSQSRVDQPAAEAAIGRLHEATGRPVLTAAATGRAAIEGYKGHGVFTYALIDALKNADSSGDGLIDLKELAAHVQTMVPRISAEMRGGGAAGDARAALTIGGGGDRAALVQQSARFGSRGESFIIGRRLP